MKERESINERVRGSEQQKSDRERERKNEREREGGKASAETERGRTIEKEVDGGQCQLRIGAGRSSQLDGGLAVSYKANSAKNLPQAQRLGPAVKFFPSLGFRFIRNPRCEGQKQRNRKATVAAEEGPT